jgi:hypothetical protein
MPEDQHPLLTTKTFGLVGLASLACAGIGFMIASPNVFWGGAIVAAFAAGGIVWLASSDYRVAYAKIFQQHAWREGARRVDNGAQVCRVAELALHRGLSVDFSDYWQRHHAAKAQPNT